MLLPEPMKPVRTMRRGWVNCGSGWASGWVSLDIRMYLPGLLCFQYRSWRCGLAEDDDDSAGGDEQAAYQGCGGERFAEQQPGEEHDEGHAELVERRNTRGRAQLQGAEVAEPRQAGGQAGEREEEQGAAVESAQLVVLAKSERDAPGKDDDDGGAYGGGQV